MSSLLGVSSVDVLHRYPRRFLICDFCFWAASAIGGRQHEVDTCPQCGRQVSSIPLGDDERFTFSRDSRRGVELAFASPRKLTSVKKPSMDADVPSARSIEAAYKEPAAARLTA
jgi:hypothetical protein